MRYYWEKRVVVSFSQMIHEASWTERIPKVGGASHRVCVCPFPQEGSISPFGYHTHFHTQLSLPEPGEEKNRPIS